MQFYEVHLYNGKPPHCLSQLRPEKHDRVTASHKSISKLMYVCIRCNTNHKRFIGVDKGSSPNFASNIKRI